MAEEEKKKPNLTFLFLFAFLAGLVVLGVGTWVKSGKTASPAPAQIRVLGETEATELEKEPITVKGSAEAVVTIVEFSDFQCPACGSAQPAVSQALENFKGQVRVIFRHFPLTFHSLARPAALASLCAEEQDRFWEYHDKIFENQSELSQASLKDWASQLDLDEAEFNTCLDEKRYEERVNSDYELGLKWKVGGTPTFFVNGQMVEWKDKTEGWLGAISRYIKAGLGE